MQTFDTRGCEDGHLSWTFLPRTFEHSPFKAFFLPVFEGLGHYRMQSQGVERLSLDIFYSGSFPGHVQRNFRGELCIHFVSFFVTLSTLTL